MERKRSAVSTCRPVSCSRKSGSVKSRVMATSFYPPLPRRGGEGRKACDGHSIPRWGQKTCCQQFAAPLTITALLSLLRCTMLTGQQLGPFVIEKELGSGAMGAVYRGLYTKTGQRVAIKVMLPGAGENENAQKRFRHEAEILKK